MKQCYELINEAWVMAKRYFNAEPQTIEEYHELENASNDRLKEIGNKYGFTSKEYNFARRLFVAVNEYTDAEWRERNTGIQTNLWGQ